jgi:hypothetical protein
LGIFELSGNGEDSSIIRFEIFLTWQPVFMVSQVWPRLEYHLLITRSGRFVIF